MTAAPLTPTDVAARWSRPDRPFPRRRVLRWCEKGVFDGAFRVGNRWAIPYTSVLRREGDNPEGGPA